MAPWKGYWRPRFRLFPVLAVLGVSVKASQVRGRRLERPRELASAAYPGDLELALSYSSALLAEPGPTAGVNVGSSAYLQLPKTGSGGGGGLVKIACLETRVLYVWKVVNYGFKEIEDNKTAELLHCVETLKVALTLSSLEAALPSETSKLLSSEHGILLLCRLECSVRIIPHCRLQPGTLGSNDLPALASQVVGPTSACHPARKVFFLRVTVLLCFQVGLELLASSEPPASTSQVAVVTGSLLPRLECSGAALTHYNLHFSGSNSSCASAPSSSWDYRLEMGFHHVGQASLELLVPLEILLPPTLQCSGVIATHCNLSLPSSWDYRCTPRLPANFCIFGKIGFCHVGQAGLGHLTSSDHLPWPTKVLELQHFGGLRRAGHLMSGVWDQAGQYDGVSPYWTSWSQTPNLRLGLALSPRVECSSVIMAHCSLSLLGSCSVTQTEVQWHDHGSLQPQLLGSSHPSTAASLVAGTTGTCPCS
ncbi:hypothetical protein AAY473_037483 [Plecturocebus cupreus]